MYLVFSAGFLAKKSPGLGAKIGSCLGGMFGPEKYVRGG